MQDRMVYLDNNATTPLHPKVQEAMAAAFGTYGNASSLHAFGRKARKQLEDARENIASFIGAEPDEIIFSGSGSEANNTVLNIYSWDCVKKESCGSCGGGKGIVTSAIEHPCIMEASKCLQERGVHVSYSPVDSTGKLEMKALEQNLTDSVGLVSIMTANNEIGTIQDIRGISDLAHSKGLLFHTDAVQAVGKIPVNVDDMGVDFLSFSAHKIYGPKGVGVLYVKKGTPYCPLIRGGHQEQGRRAGTENTLGITGLNAAITQLREEMDEEIPRQKALRDRLQSGITDKIPDIYINGHPEDILPGTLNISFEGAEGEAILLYLDLEGIAVSTGSACSSGSLDPSHVLIAAGAEAERAHGSIRFSLGRENTKEDIDYVLEKLPPVIDKIRNMSTAYGGK